jgi:hypothetical protein
MKLSNHMSVAKSISLCFIALVILPIGQTQAQGSNIGEMLKNQIISPSQLPDPLVTWEKKQPLVLYREEICIFESEFDDGFYKHIFYKLIGWYEKDNETAPPVKSLDVELADDHSFITPGLVDFLASYRTPDAYPFEKKKPNIHSLPPLRGFRCDALDDINLLTARGSPECANMSLYNEDTEHPLDKITFLDEEKHPEVCVDPPEGTKCGTRKFDGSKLIAPALIITPATLPTGLDILRVTDW